MEQIGYSLVDANGAELQFWGDTKGVCAGIPEAIDLPNGDRVHCPAVGEIQQWKLVPRMLKSGNIGAVLDGENFEVTRPEPIPPVPQIVSDRQFFQQLCILGLITEDEALAAVGPGTLPASLAALVAELPEEQQFAANMLLKGATQFDRAFPMVAVLGQAFGMSSEQIDQIWVDASQL
jgi:hypothetical protein